MLMQGADPTSLVPVPGAGVSDLIAAPPGDGPGYWAGAPSCVSGADGGVYLAYRMRRPVEAGRGYATVVAHAEDGVHFRTLCELRKEEFDTDSFERPALVQLPDGRWRLYVSVATRATKHWRIEAVDADRPEEFDAANRRVVTFRNDDGNAYKDPVVEHDEDGWRMWVCRHVVDPPDEADAMATMLATSTDGLAWESPAMALEPQPGRWDSRGTRLASVVPGGKFAYYDGRASAAENWEERTGIAARTGAGTWVSVSAEPLRIGPAGLRYLSLAEVPGGVRFYYEITRPDGAHALRSEYAPLPEDWSQSS